MMEYIRDELHQARFLIDEAKDLEGIITGEKILLAQTRTIRAKASLEAALVLLCEVKPR